MTVVRLFAVNAVIRAAAAVSGQLFAFLLAEHLSGRVGVGASLVGLVGACFFATELVGAPIAGRRADLRGQRHILRRGPLFGALCGMTAALAAFGHLELAALATVLVAARTAEGLSAACAVPTTLALLSRATDGDGARRTRIMGLFELTSLLAMIAGYALAGIAWDAVGAGAFLALPSLYAVAWVFVGRGSDVADVAPGARDDGRSTWSLIASLVRERGNLAFGLAWLAVNAVVGVWLQQAPYLLKLPERSPTQSLVGGFTGREIGMVFGAWGVAFLAGLLSWSFFGARVPRLRALSVALVAMLGVAVALSLANHGAGRWTLGLATAFVLVESGFTPAALAHLAEITQRHDASRGTALGLYSLLLGSGQLAGNLLGAPVAARWQMDGVLGLTFALALGALACIRGMRVSPATAPGGAQSFPPHRR